MIRNRNIPDMRKYLSLCEIKVESCSKSYIQKLNLAAQEMHKKTKKEAENDIRMYF